MYIWGTRIYADIIKGLKGSLYIQTICICYMWYNPAVQLAKCFITFWWTRRKLNQFLFL